jgi:hypothetical protein
LASLLIAVAVAALTLQAQTAFATPAYAVRADNFLISFDTNDLGSILAVGPITNLLPGEDILAIDVRPLTGRLYGVSASHLYLIDPVTAAASLVSPTAFATLAGNVAMDFDPVTGLIRIVTDTNQNLRINPLNGSATADTAITPAAQIAATAFTNSFSSPDRATLYGIDANTDQLVRIGSVDVADGGASQSAGVVTTIGPLGVDTSGLAGFDIAANDNAAYVVLTPEASIVSSLYRVNLTTGAATLAGAIPTGGGALRAFALFSRATTLYGLTSSNAIVTFLSAVPGTLLPQPSGTPIAIVGLGEGETIVAIDTRPDTGALYGYSSANRLFVINPASGLASTALAVAPVVTGTVLGMDFNPVSNQIRIATDDGAYFQVNPDTGAVTVLPAVNPGGVSVVGLAFTNNRANVGTTELYGIDATANQLVRMNGVSEATASPVGGVLGIDAGPLTGFEIVPADGAAFAAITTPAGTSTTLYTINLTTGAATAIGAIGGGTTIRGLATAATGAVRLSANNYSALENAGTALVSVERINGSEGPLTVKLEAQTTPSADAADFVPSTYTVEFAEGETSKTVNIVILDDTLVEGAQTVNLVLSDPRLGASLSTPTAATLTIVDNDPSAGGQAPTIDITSPTSISTYTATSLYVTVAGTATDPDGQITSVTWVNNRGGSGTASSGAATQTVDWFASDVPLQPGVNTITATVTDNAGNQSQDAIVITLNDLSYYLAEGATGGFFDLDLLIANPNATPAVATVTYLKNNGGGTIVQHYTIGRTSRRTIDVETVPGLEAGEVSTTVTVPATTPLIVERTMTWDGSGYGSHTDKASPATSTKWYFAEGSQGFFFTYLLLANPENAVNDVSVTYFREGNSPITRVYHLQPLERFTVDVGQDADLVNSSFGMEVTFTLPGIAERAMYFGLSPLWIGGHESVGVTLPSREWFLAEGATGPFFETFVLFSNPGATPATVDVRYLPSFVAPVIKQYTVPAQGRLTVNVEAEDPSLLNEAVATQVTSDVPILVERAQYWPDPFTTWYEAHNSFGVTAAGTKWGLAEGRVGGASNYQTYILLANTNPSDASVDIQFLKEDGTTVMKSFVVGANRRLSVSVGTADVPEITEGSFGAVITSSLPIAVERAMYSDALGHVWEAGTNATATRLQ